MTSITENMFRDTIDEQFNEEKITHFERVIREFNSIGLDIGDDCLVLIADKEGNNYYERGVVIGIKPMIIRKRISQFGCNNDVVLVKFSFYYVVNFPRISKITDVDKSFICKEKPWYSYLKIR